MYRENNKEPGTVPCVAAEKTGARASINFQIRKLDTYSTPNLEVWLMKHKKKMFFCLTFYEQLFNRGILSESI